MLINIGKIISQVFRSDVMEKWRINFEINLNTNEFIIHILIISLTNNEIVSTNVCLYYIEIKGKNKIRI